MTTRLSLCFAVLSCLFMSKSAYAAGCAAWEDDRRSVIPGLQVGGGFRFEVNRVVGMGTSTTNDPEGRLLNPNTAIQNRVLDDKACIGLKLRVKLTPGFYHVVREQIEYNSYVLPLFLAGGFAVGSVQVQLGQDGLIYTGSGQILSLPVTIQVFFNGQPLVQQTVPAPIHRDGYEKLFPVSVKIDPRAIKFARHRLEHVDNGISCVPPQQIDPPNCVGTNQLSYAVSVPPVFEQLNIGLNSAQVTANVATTYLNFSAMPPIVLLPGCCGNNLDFWYRPNLGANTHLVSMLRDVNMPTFLPRAISPTTNSPQGPIQYWNRITGSTESGGEQAAIRARAAARWFGSKWVHVVAHSKGGLNARFLLGKHLLDQPTGGQTTVGVRSLITMNTPHMGAVGADIAQQLCRGVIINLPGPNAGPVPVAQIPLSYRQCYDPKGIQNNADLTQAEVENFNRKFKSPPQQIAVGGVTRRVAYGAYAADANADASQEPGDGRKIISAAEAEGFLYGSNSLTSQLALNYSYDLLGRAIGVKKLLPLAFQVIFAPGFRMNDGTVGLQSQVYAGEASAPALPSFALISALPQESQLRLKSGANHEGVATRSRGELLVDFYKSLPR